MLDISCLYINNDHQWLIQKCIEFFLFTYSRKYIFSCTYENNADYKTLFIYLSTFTLAPLIFYLDILTIINYAYKTVYIMLFYTGLKQNIIHLPYEYTFHKILKYRWDIYDVCNYRTCMSEYVCGRVRLYDWLHAHLLECVNLLTNVLVCLY